MNSSINMECVWITRPSIRVYIEKHLCMYSSTSPNS